VTAQEKLGSLVDDHLAPRLAADGFARRRGPACFVRRRDAAWQVLELGKNRYATSAHLEFAAELGVAADVLADREPAWSRRGWPREWECPFRHRVFGDDQRWFGVSRRSSVTRLASRVLQRVEEVALPWLDLYADPPRLLREIASEPRVLHVYDPDPLVALARKIGTEDERRAVDRAVDLTVEHLRGLEDRARL